MFISDETLRVIHLVARHQSITTAAEQLNKVPSAISYTIKKAEESLGVELFIRKGRYIELSPSLYVRLFGKVENLVISQREVTSSNIAKLFLATWKH